MKSVLIVDDEAICRMLFSRILQHAGYAVQTATDGQTALHEVASRRFDAVLLDMTMPGLDGRATAMRIREAFEGNGERLPRLALLSAAPAVKQEPAPSEDWPFDARLCKDMAVAHLPELVASLFERTTAPDSEGMM